MLKEERFDNLVVQQYGSREDMGNAAGKAVVQKINEILKTKEEVRIIFAAAPSQNEMLAYLVSHKDEADWRRVTAFHMDEYIGLDESSEQLFSFFLHEKLFDHLPFKKINTIDSKNLDETERYTQLLLEEKIDIVCLGIGENGHLAFNDPPVADFNDPRVVKIVELDDICRNQQVNDGCFPTLIDVPETAISLTIPTLFNADFLFCVVPGNTKREAVNGTLHSSISEKCPSTILRSHKHCILYVDKDSYTEKRGSI
jgi:glucosamine-6-phosphate deaminase